MTTSKFPGTKKDLAQKCTRRRQPRLRCYFHVAYRERGHFVGGRGAAGFKPGPQAPSREGDTGRQAGALNLQVYECERCDWEQRLNIWQRNGRSTDTNKSRPLCPSVRPRARPGQFARIRSMKFIGLLARSGHAASERGGRRAEGCERARRAAAFRVPTEPKNLRPHGARLVRFIPSWAGGSAAVEADRHRPSEIRKHKSLISFFAQSHRNRQSPGRRKAVKIRRLLLRRQVGRG